MTLDVGDRWSNDGGYDVTLTSDGTGSQGDVVKFDGDVKVTPTTDAGDEFLGVLAEDSPADGEKVLVRVYGDVVLTAEGSIDGGDLCVPDTVDGTVSSAGKDGQAVDEGGTATYTVYTRAIVAMEDAADGEAFNALIL